METGAGRAWLFYIFGVCQWLPTNYRINYYTDDILKRHCASLGRRKLWIISYVARLVEEQINLKQVIKSNFSDWNIPYSTLPFISREQGLRSRWKSAARGLALNEITSSRLDILTNGFWKANQAKPFISTRNFLMSIESTGQAQDIPFLQPPTSPRPVESIDPRILSPNTWSHRLPTFLASSRTGTL